ncbi:hypothetical protein H5410_008111 [Solanum commersonii]|uniref:Uncharacterized protein n=1 Tax=Solanum commersonii TaxID=4109 RepID=A0A9J6AE03_SOLCO|nr:hypothetical protein H5410_008111 [Solanum commersonii]
MEKPHTTQSTTDRTSKKIKPLEITEVQVMATTAAAGPSNAVGKFEPPTPTKKELTHTILSLLLMLGTI